jgi:hypothetical protein
MFGLNEVVVDGLTWSDIGGDIVSLFCFILWVVQIIRSAWLYFFYGKHGRAQILAIHTVLFVANILYFRYELITNNHNPIILIFTMRFLLNMSIVWAHQLITKEHGVKSKLHYTYLFMKILLIGVYIGGLVHPLGVHCSKDQQPIGTMIMGVF